MTAPIQISVTIQRLPGVTDGYIAEVTEPGSALRGVFAFGDTHQLARRALARTVWQHLIDTSAMPPGTPGVIVEAPVVVWFPSSTLIDSPTTDGSTAAWAAVPITKPPEARP